MSVRGNFIRGLHNVRSHHHGNVVTIGSFDGVHRGHQAIIQQVKELASQLKVPSLVMIFEPQPHEFFSGQRAPARLMRLKEKITALLDCGIDRLCCLPFTERLHQMSPPDFVQCVLHNALGTRHLVVGDDFRFGAQRTGNYDFLVTAGKQYGFAVNDTRSFVVDGRRVSSTWIRQLLQQNHFEQAAQLLGKPYAISGRVVRGQQLGRRLGAPTANIHLHRYRSPLSGVFAVMVSWGDVTAAPAVANVGVRPTLGEDDKPLLEVHLLQGEHDLYGWELRVEFKHRLREEQRFADLASLQQQIQRDIHNARGYFQDRP